MDDPAVFQGPYTYKAARKAIIDGETRGGVYMLVALDCSWIYVGSAGDVGRRLGEHKYLLKKGRHPKQKMQDDFNSGNELMRFFRRCPNRDTAYELEQHVLKVLSNHPGLLNVAVDARHAWNRGDDYVHPLKGRPRDVETRRKLSIAARRPGRTQPMLGRKHSAESIKLMSDKAKQRNSLNRHLKSD